MVAARRVRDEHRGRGRHERVRLRCVGRLYVVWNGQGGRRPASGLQAMLARTNVGPRRVEQDVIARLARDVCYFKRELRRQQLAKEDAFVKDMHRAAATRDAQLRWQTVCRWLRAPRPVAEMDAFRKGDAADVEQYRKDWEDGWLTPAHYCQIERNPDQNGDGYWHPDGVPIMSMWVEYK